MLKIFNTLSKRKEEFKPLIAKKVSFYHCGPTVYWVQHIGNMRAMVLADLIIRSLNYLGYDVKLVRNYTDVGHLTSDEDEGEDKLEKGAKREDTTPQEIADKYIKIFEQDVKILNVNEPQVKPRATQHINEMIEMVQTLIDKGYGYATDLAIYFDVSKAKDYTRMSGQNLEKNIQSAGKGKISDPNKKNPQDFALWFLKAGAHKNALQTWQSPFKSKLAPNGEGFPGWHIECSAMSKKYLGNTLDIHMGGIEHIPVHHPNEIAQSEGANGKKFVNYWIHNEHLTVNSGKMAKSEGTAYSVKDIKEKGFDPLALRYFFLNSHYRSKQNFTWEALKSAGNSLKNLKNKILEFRNNPSSDKNSNDGKIYKQKFIAALEDDFNLPQAISQVWEMLKDNTVADKTKLDLILEFDEVLGLNLKDTKKEEIEIPDDVKTLIKKREQARKEKDWKESDKIRDEINNLGYILEDSAEGTVLKKK